MWQAWERREVHAGYWWRNLKKRYALEDFGVYGRIILKWISSMIVERGLGSAGS
jgi:hypothetical protein